MIRRLLHIMLIGAVLLTALPVNGQTVQIAEESLPAITVVTQSQSELAALGCTSGSLPAQNTATIAVPVGKPLRVTARDQVAQTIMFCSATAAQQLTIVSGTVAAATSDEEDVSVCNTPDGAEKYWCKVSSRLKFLYNLSVPTTFQVENNYAANVALGVAAGTVTLAANIVGEVGDFVLKMALQLLVFSLATPTFITNPLVTTGWPFVQGIANLGFMLALLFIAFATTLRLEGFSATRQLPRLLIAAVLINFSLIIAGVIIDVARILMAIIINTLGNVSMDQLPAYLRNSSGIAQITTGFKITGAGKYNIPATALFKAVATWTIALSFLTLALTLLVRYIALILLLIVSPIAYLGFALPQTESFAKQWWTTFFKYVFAGPIALFFLILIIQVTNLNGGISTGDTAMAQILNSLVLVAMLVIGSVASTKLADKGSAAAVGAFSKQAKRTGMWAGKKAVGTATYLPRQAGKRVSDTAKDFGRDVSKNIRKSNFAKSGAGKLLLGPERDGKGKPKAGQSSLGTSLAGRATGWMNQKQQANAQTATSLRSQYEAGTMTLQQVADSDLVRNGGLADAGVTSALGKALTIQVAGQTKHTAGVRSLVANKEFSASMDDRDKSDLADAIANNDQLDAPKKKVNITVKDSSGNVLRTEEQEHDSSAEIKAKILEQLYKDKEADS